MSCSTCCKSSSLRPVILDQQLLSPLSAYFALDFVAHNAIIVLARRGDCIRRFVGVYTPSVVFRPTGPFIQGRPFHMRTLPYVLVVATVAASLGASLACTSSPTERTDASPTVGPPTTINASSPATADTGLSNYTRDVAESLRLARMSGQSGDQWVDTEEPAKAVVDALRKIIPPPSVRAEHLELVARANAYVRVFDSLPIQSQPALLRPYLETWAMDTYEACVQVQRALTRQNVRADIGCDDTSLRIVRPCLTQRIPGPRLTGTDAGEAHSQAEDAFATLVWPAVPTWVTRYGVTPITLYSPLHTDGDPVFRDALRDQRTGVVLWFSDEKRERIMRIAYAPVPSCEMSPVYVRQIENVEVTYTQGTDAIAPDSDLLYEIVTGEFVLPSVAVSMELAYDRASAPSKDDRAGEFVSWAQAVIAAGGAAH